MSDDYQEAIREPMRQLADKGGDLREDVRRLVTDALLDKHLDPKALREIMKATVEGLGEGLSGHAETAAGSLKTAMSGLDEALGKGLYARVARHGIPEEQSRTPHGRGTARQQAQAMKPFQPDFQAVVALVHDSVALAASWVFVFVLLRGMATPTQASDLALALSVAVPLQALVSYLFGVYQGIWRYTSLPDVQRIIFSILAGTVAVAALLHAAGLGGVLSYREYALYPLILVAIMFTFGIPIAASLGLAALIVLTFLSPVSSMQILPQLFGEAATSFVLLAVPLFILAGFLMEKGTVGRNLIEFASSIVSPAVHALATGFSAAGRRGSPIT